MLPKIKRALCCQLSALSQTGNSLVILLLIAGLITSGVILEQKYGKGLPEEPSASASPSPVNYQASLTLTSDKELNSIKTGDTFKVTVGISSSEAINLISTNIRYPKELLKVIEVDDLAEQSPISLWVTKDDISDQGYVQLVGGIPSPGLNTQNQPKPLAQIVFQAPTDLPDAWEVKAEDIQLYSNSTNQPLEKVAHQALQPKTVSPSPIQNISSPMTSAILQKGKGKLSLSPKIIQSSPGCTFDVILRYDSGGNEFLGIDTLLTIDPRVLKPISIQTTDQAPDSLFAPQLSLKNDTITIAYLSPNNREYQKKAEIGKITFKTTDQPTQGLTAIKVKFNHANRNDLADSNILYSLKEDLLSEVENTIVAIKPGSCNPEKTYEILKSN